MIGATIADLHNQRREAIEGGRTVYTEPDRIIIRDPGGQAYVRGNDLYRFRYGARDIRTDTIGGETRTVVIRPDGGLMQLPAFSQRRSRSPVVGSPPRRRRRHRPRR